MAESELTWEAPGPGHWQLEVEHMSSTLTPVFRGIWTRTEREGFKAASASYGAPMSHPELRFVNDWAYMRIMPLVDAGPPDRPPPGWLMAVLVRVVPLFRRRERAARRMFEQKGWRREVAEWRDVLRPRWVEANLALQAEDVRVLDDAALAGHLDRAFAHAADGSYLHFVLHGPDLFVPGDLLAACDEWGIAPRDVLPLLQGHSPASAETAARLRRINEALVAAGVDPATVDSLDDVRAAGADAREALDAYLLLYGNRVVSGYDVDSLTLIELPALVLACLASPPENPAGPGPAPAEVEAVRSRVPAADRSRFDELLEEARLTYGLRDDNVGLTYMWPVGLLRRALVEAASRLVTAGSLLTATDIYELEPEEVTALMRGAAGAPNAADAAARAERRDSHNAATPPLTLGPEEPLPPLDRLTPWMRRSARAVLAYANTMATAPTDGSGLRGSGVGTVSYTGRARVASSPAEALAVIEPGDVLVTPFTTPAYNAVLPILGALISEEGGALSHAAIVARELGIPAVIGATGACRAIADGSTVEVDPEHGAVRVVAGVGEI